MSDDENQNSQAPQQLSEETELHDNADPRSTPSPGAQSESDETEVDFSQWSPQKLKEYKDRMRKIMHTDHVFELWKGKVDKKLELSEPYRMFMSPIVWDPRTHAEESTLSFPELLDKSLGTLVETLHISFVINLNWLLVQYRIADQRCMRTTLLYGTCAEDIDELHSRGLVQQVTHKKIKSVDDVSHQHSNVSMFAYDDGSLRVVVMTPHLREEDWTHYAQGIWVSPRFPLKKKDDKSDGNSKTNFKVDILRYLMSFREKSLNQWIIRIKKVDFSQANVFFIPSVPGKHKKILWGHLYLKKILKKHACLPFGKPAEWPIIAQCTSLGSLGTTDKEWLIPEFIESLSASTNCGDTDTDNDPIPFNLIYPAERNVLQVGGPTKLARFALIYRETVYKNQLWLNNHMHFWRCCSRKRSMSFPKLKTYCRISSCLTEMSWFLLTSANLSKGAWGKKLDSDKQSNFMMGYEAGVLFLPKFLIGSDTFPIDPSEPSELPYFSLPFDLPLTKYNLEEDKPFYVPDHLM